MSLHTWSAILVLSAFLLVALPAEAQDSECEEGTEGCPPPCPTNLHGTAPQTGGVFMSWQLNSATDVNVYKENEEGSFELLERLEFPATRYLDHDTEPGVAYRYQVTAIGELESEACETLEVVAVPFFPTALAAFAGVALSVGAYVALRRADRR